jgi:hypothetical protein
LIYAVSANIKEELVDYKKILLVLYPLSLGAREGNTTDDIMKESINKTDSLMTGSFVFDLLSGSYLEAAEKHMHSVLYGTTIDGACQALSDIQVNANDNAHGHLYIITIKSLGCTHTMLLVQSPLSKYDDTGFLLLMSYTDKYTLSDYLRGITEASNPHITKKEDFMISTYAKLCALISPESALIDRQSAFKWVTGVDRWISQPSVIYNHCIFSLDDAYKKATLS